jgi:hypothetical protein
MSTIRTTTGNNNIVSLATDAIYFLTALHQRGASVTDPAHLLVYSRISHGS